MAEDSGTRVLWKLILMLVRQTAHGLFDASSNIDINSKRFSSMSKAMKKSGRIVYMRKRFHEFLF